MKLLTRFFIILSLLTSGSFVLAADNYKLIDPAQATHVSEGKIEVVEVFWYGCPHCYDFEPYITPWLEDKDEDIEFRRVPGIFSEKWIPHARAYFAAMELGVLDKVHSALFHAMHKEKRKLNDQSSLTEFFVEQGIDKDAFTQAYESEAVNDKVKKAFVAGRRYQVRGVPSIVVNGKYLISTSSAGDFENMLKITEQLVDKERK